MIKSKSELRFYIKADRIMNGLPEVSNFKEYIKNALIGGELLIILLALERHLFIDTDLGLFSQ